MEPIISYSHPVTNRRVVELVTSGDLRGRRVLDVGAGEGYLASRIGEHVRQRYGVAPPEILSACDLFPDLFKYPGLHCDQVPPDGRLPYEDGTFDIVTCVEVFEHIEDQFQQAREFHRVLKPGGRLLLTTPNLLNINSRLRNLHSGFAQLFDPLPLDDHCPVHLGGHIHPVNFYFLAYIFRRAGFRELIPRFDFQKRSGFALAAIFYLPIRLWHFGFHRRMRRKYGEVYEENRPLLRHINRWRMLTSRTLILDATR